MTKRNKVVERVLARPPLADFNDVRQLLELHGWVQARQSGSHISFTKPGEKNFVIPLTSGSKVKRIYLDEICDRLGLG